MSPNGLVTVSQLGPVKPNKTLKNLPVLFPDQESNRIVQNNSM
jgi:hypothetical protein